MKIRIQVFPAVVMLAASLMAFASSALAQSVTWDGSTDMTWSQPDSTSWSGDTYVSGDTANFLGAGAGTVTIVGIVTPAAVNVSGANYTFTGGEIGGPATLTVSNCLLTLSNINTNTGRTTVTGDGVLDVGTITNVVTTQLSTNQALEIRSGLFLGSTSTSNGIYGILQGNGTFTRTLFTSDTPGPNDVSGAAGGFAARGGTLTVNFGGAGAQIELVQGDYRFGDNFVFGSSTADSQVILVNPIDLNGTTTNYLRLFTVIAGVGGDSAEFQGQLSDNPAPVPNGICKDGNGLLILSAANTYTGTTDIRDGTLQLTGSFDPASSLDLGTNDIGDSCAFILGSSNGAINQTISGLWSDVVTDTNGAVLSIDTNGAVVGGNASVSTLTVNLNADNLNGNNYTFAGSLGGPGTNENNLALTISGVGTETLSGNNTYTGSTTVNGGELLVNGSLATGSTVAVNTGGTLGGSGMVNGSVQVNAGGAIAPGSDDTNTTLTVANNLTLNTGASMCFWLNTTNPAGANSYLAVSGTQSITGSTLTVTNLGPALYTGETFTLLSQPTSGFTTLNLPLLPSGYMWSNNLAIDGTIQVVPPPPKTLYVSPSGADTNIGTIDAPFKTLTAAVSLLGPGDTLYLRGGTYHETLQPINSGTSNAPITIAAYNGETVTLSACDLVTNTWLLASNGIYSAAVGWDLGEGYNQVFVDGSMQHEAQFPDWTVTNSLLNPATVNVTVTSASAASNPNTISSAAFDGQAANFFVGARFVGGVGDAYGWQTAVITNSNDNLLTVDPTTESIGWWPDYYAVQGETDTTATGIGFVYGNPNLLDADREWFLQTNATGPNTLSLRINGGANPTTHVVELKHRDWCVDISNCDYITVRGLHTCGGAILLDGTGNVLENVDASFLSHFMVWPAYDTQNGGRPEGGGVVLQGNNNIVNGCAIHDTAGSGITVTGYGHLITRNHIFNIDYSGTYGTPVALFSSATNIVVTFNTINDSGRDLVRAAGAGHSILYNDLSGMGKLCKDLGAVYMGDVNGQAVGGNETRIAFNWVHDGTLGGHRIQGIYFDNYTCNLIADHNVCWNIGDPGAHGIYQNAPSEGKELYHNTLLMCDTYDDATSVAFPIDNPDPTFWTTNNVELFFTAQNNLVLTNASAMNSNLMNAAEQDFRLQAGSSAVNPAPTTNLIAWCTTDGVNNVPLDFSLQFGAGSTPNQLFCFQETGGQGVVVPGINDGYQGMTPDNGAYESGAPYWEPGEEGFTSGDPGIMTLPPVPAITSMTLNGTVASLGSGATSADVTVFWGTTDGGTNPVAWSNQVTVTNGLAAIFTILSYNVTNLVPSQNYVYRFFMVNSLGQTAWTMPCCQRTLIPTTPTTLTNLAWEVTGNTVTISWPSNYLGWILQVQTNGMNANGWFDVPDSAGVTFTNITIDPANASVFYRLRYP